MKEDQSIFVHSSAVLIGLVEIGSYSSIWPNAVIRADKNTITIGKGVSIQDNATLHVDSKQGITIGDYSLIAHNAVLHSCTIGKACMVGIGSIILEGAVIGDGSMIMAGSVIRGKTKVPSNSMVVSKQGELIIYENRSRPIITIAGCLEYIELATRFKNNIWGPIPPDVSKKHKEEAKNIFKEIF